MLDYKYNELDYAEIIYKNGFQTKHFPTELRLLAIYFKLVLNLKPKERETEIYKFCNKYIPNFKREKFFKTINTALRTASKKIASFVVISKLEISKSELDYLNNLDIKYEYKKVMFAFLIQLKLNKIVYEVKKSKTYNNIYFKGGKKKYNNIKKMANISNKISINDEVINELDKLGLIKILHKGVIILDYINNCIPNDEIVMTIIDYNNVGLYFDYYNKIDKVKKCENCDTIIKVTNNKIKYCKKCAEEIEKSNWAERKRKQRTKCHEIEKSENT